MNSGNRIGIVGAGLSGLVSAKVLSHAGFTVEVFDRAPDLGGVWGATRRYAGRVAQSSKRTYCFSDYPMPAVVSDRPDGEHMQAYLTDYAHQFGIIDAIRLNTEVVAADPVAGGWMLEIRDSGGIHRTSCDHLVVANGLYNQPAVPRIRGAAAYQSAGGAIGHSSDFVELEAVRGRSVLILGYGDSARELAEAISPIAASTTLVARRPHWLLPRRTGKFFSAERLTLTRTAAAHYRRSRGDSPGLLRTLGRSFRESNLDLAQALAAKRLRFDELGLAPTERFREGSDAVPEIVNESFADLVAQGAITVHAGAEIAELSAGPEGPAATLTTGQQLQADIVVCATGFAQQVPFLTPYIQRQLTDAAGNFRLYRNLVPIEVPHLSFAGYAAGPLTPLTAELGAHWTAALLRGAIALPTEEVRAQRIEQRLAWLQTHCANHASGTSVAPFIIDYLDELMADLGRPLSSRDRWAQWVRPVTPATYALPHTAPVLHDSVPAR